MGWFELFLIAIGLSMDAFAVAVCQGLAMPRFHWRYAVVLALYFGGFQALMPLLGWTMGGAFADSIQRVDHWLVFILLSLIGGNMIREALEDGEDTAAVWDGQIHHGHFLLMAIATSIDALAVGVTFAFLQAEIIPAVLVIGTTTFGLSLAGAQMGNRAGGRYGQRAKLTGGVILILLGCKILIEHLFL